MSDKTNTQPPGIIQPVAVTARLSDARVATYLRRHPLFFDKHPELLAHLDIPHNSGASSLIERQVKQLRKKNEELTEQLHELVGIAEANGKLFDHFRQVTLALLDLEHADLIGQKLIELLRLPFNCQEIALLCFNAEASAPWLTVDIDTFNKQLPGILNSHRAMAGKWRRNELRFLFGDAGLSLSSAAIIPLRHNDAPLGVIALGSTSISHFRSSMDTLFISYLGDVTAKLLARSLLPAPLDAAP